MVSLMVMHGVWAVMLGAGTLVDVPLMHGGLTRNLQTLYAGYVADGAGPAGPYAAWGRTVER